jgi:hypothetical protein
MKNREPTPLGGADSRAFFGFHFSFTASQDRVKGSVGLNQLFAVALRFFRQAERYLMIQSVNACSKPMSRPAFCDSIHLCLRISSRSAWNSRYNEEFFNRSAEDESFAALGIGENLLLRLR